MHSILRPIEDVIKDKVMEQSIERKLDPFGCNSMFNFVVFSYYSYLW